MPPALALLSLALALPATSQDVNAGLAGAIRSGASSYILPASVVLSAPLEIPAGTRGFLLLGAPGGTTLKATKGIGYAISAGVQTGWNQWPISTYPSSTVGNVASGARSATLEEGLRLKVGDYVCLWDKQWVKHRNGDAQTNRMEPLRVAAIDGRTVTFDRAVSREYDLEPSVSVVSDRVLVDLTVRGISFDASYAGGRNNGILSVGLVAGLTCQDLATTDFGSRSLQVNVGRDVRLERVVTRRGAGIGNPGSGYGPTFMKVHNAAVVDCESEQTRHGFMCTNGSTDVRYANCRSLGDNGNFDTHGFDERRISWTGCKATGTLNLGNTEYLAGGQDFTVKDCDFGFSCWVSANVKRVRVSSSRFWGVAWQSQNNPKSRPSEGRAEDVRFEGCTFRFQKNAFIEKGDVDGLVFDRCSFASGTDPYTQFMTLRWTTGSVLFRDCTVAMNGTGVYTPIVLSQTNADTFSLTLEHFTMTAKAPVWSAVQLAKGFRGTLKATDSSVATKRAQALFVDDQGAVRKAVQSRATVRR